MNKNHCKIKNKYGNIKIEQNRPKNHIKKYTNIKSEIKKGEKRKMKKNKGITLIALVITIIVLLILAGVAIAMLSGENGILKKAAEAKTGTEQAQKEEETTLTDMEITTSFLTNNSKYKCRYGFITGINPGDKVQDLQSKLPQGYNIELKYVYDTTTKIGEDKTIVESEKDNTDISTGMAVVKEGNIVARTVVFGDICCNRSSRVIDGLDYSYLSNYAKGKNELGKIDFIRIAMDVNHDGKIDGKDLKLIKYHIQREETKIIWNKSALDPSKIIEDKESILCWSQITDETDVYRLEYYKDIDEYKFKIKTSVETKTGDLLNVLPEGSKIERNGQEITTTENIQNGDEVICVYNEKEVYVGKIIIE